MEEKKIGVIREELAATPVNELEKFIAVYATDERSGVRKLVETASKRLKKQEEEKARTRALWEYENQYGRIKGRLTEQQLSLFDKRLDFPFVLAISLNPQDLHKLKVLDYYLLL